MINPRPASCGAYSLFHAAQYLMFDTVHSYFVVYLILYYNIIGLSIDIYNNFGVIT